MTQRESIRLGIILSAASIGWMFGPGLFLGQVPAFRDGFHFYYPQAVWLEQQRLSGQLLPRWNGHESFGVTVSGQPSATLFYPLRPIWWLPGLSVEQRYAVFLGLHVIIAICGIYWCARRMGRDPAASLLAGLAYGLSAPVIFQHSNLIYLCSAAWIGWALAAMVRFLRTTKKTPYALVELAAFIALMMLAGDFHTGINVLLIFVAVTLAYTLRDSWHQARLGSLARAVHAAACSFAQLLGCVGLIALLASPQWVPTTDWLYRTESRRSDRIFQTQQPAPVEPRTTTCRQIAEVLDQTDEAEPNTFDFSLAPWSLLTLAWPTIGGHFLPEHSRWWTLLSAEPRMWIPSLYCGFIPLTIALFRLRRPATWSNTEKWLLVIAAFALFMAWGNFTPIWILRNGLVLIGLDTLASQLPADRLGGPYYWTNQFVPGYELFRYPAKWVVLSVAAFLCACVNKAPVIGAQLESTATGTAGATARPAVYARWWAAAAIPWVAIAALFYLAPQWLPWKIDRSDAWFGPVDPQAAARTILLGAAWPVGVLLVWCGIRRTPWSWLHGGRGVILLTWLELTLVSGAWVTFVAPRSIDQPHAKPISTKRDGPPRVWADISEADYAADQASLQPSDFVSQQAQYQADFLLARLGLLYGIDTASAIQSLPAAPVSRLRSELMRLDSLEQHQPELDRLLGMLGVQYRLVRVTGPDGVPKLRWMEVPSAQPLCQLFDAQRPDLALSEDQIRGWKWLSPQELEIAVDVRQDALLLVRIFNAGNCSARVYRSNGLGTVIPAPRGPFFLELNLPAGTQIVHLDFR